MHKRDMKRVAIYTRVSTDLQDTAMQLAELNAWASHAGHKVVKVYEDKGISGAKGRDQRPQFDAMLKDSVRRKFDIIAVWSSDRLGRSLSHLVEVLQIIKDTGTGLYIHTQAVDTTSPAGRAMFQMLGVFSEFEREMIRARVQAGVNAAIARGVRFGRPEIDPEKKAAAVQELARGTSISETARLVGLGHGTVQRIRDRI